MSLPVQLPMEDVLNNMGVQKRIALYCGVGILLGVAVLAYVAFDSQRAGIQKTLDERLLVAHALADAIDSQLAHGLEMLQSVAAEMDLTDGDLGPEKELMMEANRRLGYFSVGLILVDRGSTVLWTEPYLSALEGYDMSKTQLAPLLTVDQPSVSNVITEGAQRAPTVDLMVPVRDKEGRVVGRLVGMMSLAGPAIQRLVSSAESGSTGYTQVVDEGGMVVANTKPGRRFKASTHGALAIELIGKGKAIAAVYTAEEETEEKEREVIAFAPLSVAPWGVLVEQQEEEVFAPVRDLRNRILALGGLLILSSITVAWFAARRIAVPIKALATASRRMASGDLDTPVEAVGRDEIGELARDFESMRRMLKVTNEDLTERNRQLEARDRAKTQLIATVTHDYKNPLTVIMGVSELMMHRRSDEATQRSFLEMIHREAGRLSVLVNDMLDVTRLEAGGLELSKEDVELRDVMDYCLSTYEPLPTEPSKHQFVVEVSPEVARIPADRARLTQLMMNLMGNAVKYSPDGGLITIQCHLDGTGEVLISVADQGVGIPPEAIGELFKPFFRVKNESTEGIGGTGLGLTICQQIVESHGGRIWVESEGVGKGSTFHVALPVSN